MNNKQCSAIWLNGTLVTLNNQNKPYGLLEKGAIAVQDDKIIWIGSTDDLPWESPRVVDLQGKCLTPGLIDCHTHLVYAGNRSHEFEMRLKGATYEMIAESGGGIRSTVAATRHATEEELFQQSLQRARQACRVGVTTMDIKSGYGLDLATELKILRVAKRLEETLPLSIIKTFLGAHTVPHEFQGRADEYIDYVCDVMLPDIVSKKLVDHVDVFCEKIAFTLQQTERVFQTAQKFGLQIKCHAEQLSNSSSAALAAKYQALSADHLEHLDEAGVKALAKSGTVAVLLPGAFYFLREKQMPPIHLLRKHNVPIAIATDCNPGTSPVSSLLLIINMGCTLFGLTPEEALLGVTKHAAKALGVEKRCGTLEVGKTADFAVWDVKHPAELAYGVGMSECVGVVKEGKLVFG